MNIPTDPMMLLSFINMKLRDQYGSLEELCEDLEIDITDLTDRMKSAGFEYSEENKRFW